MVKDAEANAETDKKREAVEARNQAESLLHSAEKSLKEYGDKVTADDRGAIETAIANLRSADRGRRRRRHQGQVRDALRSFDEARRGHVQGRAGQQEQQAEADAAASARNEDVVDADFEEIDDDEDKKKSA